MNKKYLKWEEVNSLWEDVNYSWEDVSILIDIENLVIKGGGDFTSYVKGNPWSQIRKDFGDEKTKRVIKLYCNYKGIEYDKSIELNEKNIKVTASDFEKFIKNSIRESISIKVNL